MNTRQSLDFTPAFMDHAGAERARWKTLDECEERSQEMLQEFSAAARAVSDDDLDITLSLFGGRAQHTPGEVMLMPYWNCVYHAGQINYIQTLYGDMKTH